MSSKHRLSVGVAAALLVAAVAGTALSTSTTFKGRNGRLLYQAQVGPNTQLFTVKPDGTGVRQITHFKDHSATDANWAPGGTRIAFTRHWDPGGPKEKLVLYTISANGGSAEGTAQGRGDVAVEPNWLPRRSPHHLPRGEDPHRQDHGHQRRQANRAPRCGDSRRRR